MVKSTHLAFPQEGVQVLVSAEDALACGINPGEPAVVEVTVREHTVEEWVAEACESNFETDDNGGEFSGPRSDPSAGSVVQDHPLIRWRSAPEPMRSTGDEEPARIRWESGPPAG